MNGCFTALSGVRFVLARNSLYDGQVKAASLAEVQEINAATSQLLNFNRASFPGFRPRRLSLLFLTSFLSFGTQPAWHHSLSDALEGANYATFLRRIRLNSLDKQPHSLLFFDQIPVGCIQRCRFEAANSAGSCWTAMRWIALSNKIFVYSAFRRLKVPK